MEFEGYTSMKYQMLYIKCSILHNIHINVIDITCNFKNLVWGINIFFNQWPWSMGKGIKIQEAVFFLAINQKEATFEMGKSFVLGTFFVGSKDEHIS